MPSAWIQSAAEALAAELSGGSIPRAGRRTARQLLARAFDAVSRDAGDAGLLRALEARLTPVQFSLGCLPLLARLDQRTRLPTISDRAWRVGAWIAQGDRAGLVARLEAHQQPYAGIARRIDRILELFRTEQPMFSKTERTHRLAEATEMETKTLTRG